MRLITHPDRLVVRFSASEVAEVGGPTKGAEITYRNGLLDNISCWLFKQSNLEPIIDRLQNLADTVVYH